jgi:hypothetical protein
MSTVLTVTSELGHLFMRDFSLHFIRKQLPHLEDFPQQAKLNIWVGGEGGGGHDKPSTCALFLTFKNRASYI